MASRAPIALDLADRSFLADPSEGLARLREAGALAPIRLPLVGRVLVTTTHAATGEVLKDSERFVIEARHAGLKGGPAGLRWWMPRSVRLVADNMLGRDDPEHRRLRRAVDRAFVRRRAHDMRGSVAARADRLLDDLPKEDVVDLMPSYARRLPLEVIADLLGVAEDDREAFARRARVFSSTAGTFGILRAILSAGGLARMVRRMIAESRVEPREGLLADLIAADELDEDELVSMVFLLLVAGMETTTNLIGGSIATLEHWPEQKAWWLEEPEARAERAVEELCRHVSAVAGTKPRFVASDTSVGGIALARGETVMALPLAANRDPAVFDAPDDLRLDRFPNPHLSFGAGVHFCLGMQLARVETQEALKRLHARFPDLSMVDERIDWAPRLGHRGPRTLRARHSR